MKLKEAYFFTLREDARDEDSISGNLLVKAGYIKKTSAGIYMMLPMGLKVANNIENIIRKHMNNAGAQELKMPALIASEYYAESGRLDGFGNSIFKLHDRSNKEFVLGPTHEELFAYAAKSMIKSYKHLPFNLYQFQTKFRDEPRARFGLVRVKEFVMKDAYTFDVDEKGLDESYQKMYKAYKDSYDEMGLNYRVVKADTGVMGGLLSEEWQAISPVGEDNIVYCDSCDYASNTEVAQIVSKKDEAEHLKMEEVETPNCKTIEDVCNFLNKDQRNSVKALLMKANDDLVIFFVRGDRDLNMAKAQKVLGVEEIEFADDALLEKYGIVPGFVGPISLKCKTVVDDEVLNMANFVIGANKEGYHYINANVEDINYDLSADIAEVKDGDLCPICGKPLNFTKGMEIGNTFKLGTKYSKAMDLQYLDQDNKLQDVWMGSYGIGIGRTMAAIVEQSYDEKGIIWPMNIAPYKVIILTMSTKDELQNEIAEKLYDELNSNNIETILDNRDERPGVKFNDAELIGIPLRITVGKKAGEGIVELKARNNDEVIEIKVDEVLKIINEKVNGSH